MGCCNKAYQASGTPSGVLIRPDGTIGSRLAQGADAIRALITTTLNPVVLGNGARVTTFFRGKHTLTRFPLWLFMNGPQGGLSHERGRLMWLSTHRLYSVAGLISLL